MSPSRLWALLLGCLIALTGFTPAFAAGTTTSALVFPVQYTTATGTYGSADFWNGAAYVPAAYNLDGTTYVPIRLVANLTGTGIGFRPPNTILISPGTPPSSLGTPSGTPPVFSGTSTLAVVEDGFFVNGQDATPPGGLFFNGTASVPAALETGGTTYVPIRLVANLLGVQISYAPGSPPTISLGSPTPINTWQSLGPAPIPAGQGGYGANEPYSGRIEAVAVSPSGEIYVGSASGGVWASTDGGGTWTDLTSKAADLAIGALAIDPTNPQVIYAGTGENDGYQSSSGPESCYDCFFGDGILKSTDGGATWTLLGSSVFSGWDIGSIAVDPANPEDVFAAGSRGVWASTDGGSTWSQEISSPAWDVVIAPGSPETLFAGVTSVGIEESTDGGLTWTPLTSGLPPAGASVGSVKIAYAPGDPSDLYASIANGTTGDLVGFYASTDGGQTWSRESPPDYMVSAGEPPQGNYDNALAVSPTNPQVVWAGGISLVFSTDGGETWSVASDASSQNVHPDIHALTFDASGSLFLGTDGGIWQGGTDGSFQDLNGNLSLTQFYQGMAMSQSGSVVLLGSQDNGTVAYVPGEGWQSLMGGDGAWNAIDGEGHAYITSDGGIYADNSATLGAAVNWTDITPPFATAPSLDPVLAWIPGTTESLLAGSDNLWLSQDGGASWTRVTDVPSEAGAVSAIAASPSDPAVIYAGWTGGLVMMSTDGGATWSEVVSGTWTFSCPDTQSGYNGYTYDQIDGVTSIAVSPSDPNTIYVGIAASSPLSYAADCAHLIVLTVPASGSATWQEISGNLPSAVNAILVDGSNIDVGTNVGVFTSAIGAWTWSALGQGLPSVQVLDLGTLPNGAILAATHGLGLWMLPGSGAGSSP